MRKKKARRKKKKIKLLEINKYNGMASLSQFLNGRRTTDKATHLSMIHPHGKYMIHGDDVDVFMDLYCRESPDRRLGLLEATAVHSILPVLVDADIKREYIDGPVEALYKPALIQKMILVYQKVLRALVASLPEEDLLCVVLEKAPYLTEKNEKSGKRYLKNGFHLHFPRLFLSKMVQEKELLPRVRLEWKKLVAQTEFNISIDSVLDRSYCRGTPWLLYRSSKSMDLDPYLISYITDADGVIHDNWRPLLMNVSLKRTDRSEVELTWDNLDFYLPRILSVSPVGRECYVREIRENLAPIPGQQIQNQIHQQINRSISMMGERHAEDEGMVDRLLAILDNHRAEDRNEWMMIGWVLYNIFRGGEEGTSRWIDFSKRSPENFSADVCRYEWGRMTRRDLTIGTLKYMAKHDNPKEYNEVMKDFMTPHIEQAMKLNGSHNDLARALFEKYEDQYVCASIKEKIWFEYADHGWNRIDEGFSLRMKISDELVRSYESMMKTLATKLANSEEEEQPMISKKLKNCIRIITMLKSAPYKTNIMKECMEVFYQPKFLKQLDTNPFLFTFQNGVYDLSSHAFREGRPSDKVSIRAPISFRDDLSHDHAEVKEVVRFFEKIFPDRSVRDYFMNISAQVFIGGNHAKIVQVWTGEGDNGKSVTQQLFEKMLGAYSVKLPTSLIVGKRTQSSAACPELVRAGNGVRIAMLQEPDGKDVINVGILKELSGNDSFFARGLYKEGSEITPMFKLVLICNDPPKLPYNDKAAWNRIRVIPFESLFSDSAPSDPDEQLLKKVFPKDTSLGDRVASMAEAFAWMLIEHLKTHPKIGEEPDKVRMATANYRKKNDIYRQFVEDHVVREPGASISVQQAYSIFKEWFREGIPNAPVPIRDDFREYMTKILGDPVMAFWQDVRIRSIQAPEDQQRMIQEEDEEDDE